jgi:hypothetical protein
MYQKLNYLISSLTPDYSEGGFMRGNIVQLTLGGYFYEMPGIIQNINITIPNDTTWEIGIPATPEQSTEAAGSNGFTDSKVKELPHRLEISMTFTPLYKFLPETVKNIYGAGNITQRFLSLEDAGGNINTLYNDGVAKNFSPSEQVGNNTSSTFIKQQPITRSTRTSVLDPFNLAGGVQRTSPIEPLG